MILDSAYVSTKKLTDEGYLKGQALVTCEGVQEYAGSEIQRDVKVPLDPNKTYKVFRPAASFLNSTTIDSLKLKPVTYEHPVAKKVDSYNYTQEAVGTIGETVKDVNGKQLLVNFIITNSDVAQYVADNQLQVSLGYRSQVVPEKGEYQGQAYDFVFKDPMKINHLAILPAYVEGRCDDKAFILDQKLVKKGDTMNNQSSDPLGAVLDDFATNIKNAVAGMVQTALQDAIPQTAKADADTMGGQVPDVAGDVTADEDMTVPDDTQMMADACTQNKIDETQAMPTSVDGSDISYSDDTLLEVSATDVDPIVQNASSNAMEEALDMLDAARTIAPSLKTDSKQPKRSLINALVKNGYNDQALSRRSSDYLLGLATPLKNRRLQALRQQIAKPIQRRSTASMPYKQDQLTVNPYLNDSGRVTDKFSAAQLRSERAAYLAKQRHDRMAAINYANK